MIKKITFSADKTLIDRAREKARREQSTLNAEFRKWLKQYARPESQIADYQVLMESLSYVKPGKSFVRDEMNER